MTQQIRPRFAVLVLAPTGVAGCVAALLLAAPARSGPPPAGDFAGLLTWSAGWVLTACCGWGALVFVALLVDVLGQHRTDLLRQVRCPAALRRTLLVLCGVGAAGALGLGGAAATGGPPSPTTPSPTGSLTGLPLPSRPETGPGRSSPASTSRPPAARTAAERAASVPRGTAREAAASPREIRVRAGDSLWRIAGRLEPEAPAPRLARLVTRIYAQNRDRIGPDPDLLRPGTRLRIPHPAPAHGRNGQRSRSPHTRHPDRSPR